MVEKHDAAVVALFEEQQREGGELVFLGTVYAEDGDAVGYLLVVGQIVDARGAAKIHEVGNAVGIGGREQHAPGVGGQLAHEGRHLVVEAHFEALVELVDHDKPHLRGLDVAFVEMVVEPAGGPEDHLRAHLPHRAVLVHRRTAAIAGHGTQSAAHAGEHRGTLQSQFAARQHHHGLHGIERGVEQFHHRQEVGQRLARAGGRKHHHVFV